MNIQILKKNPELHLKISEFSSRKIVQFAFTTFKKLFTKIQFLTIIKKIFENLKVF